MPERLFKYRRWAPTPRQGSDGVWSEVNYTERLLLDHALFCQGPRDFDDPHDSMTGAFPTGGPRDLDRFILEDMAPVVAAMQANRLSSLTQLSGVQSPDARAAIAHVAGQRHRRGLRVACLSGTGLNEIMWALYADNHRGVCLEFDGRHPCFASARRVRYAAAPAVASATDGAETITEGAFQKSTAWRFQKEWRLISTEPMFRFPPEALRRVILGYRLPESNFEALSQALSWGGYRVAVDQVQREPSSYSLAAIPRGTVAP